MKGARVTYPFDAINDSYQKAAHPRIRAIIPVHLFGGSVNMDPLVKMAADRGIPIIEDAEQSIGSEYRAREWVV